MNDWNGRHILIVGASEGIGRETAMLCARRGARLSLVARHDSVKKVAAGLDKKGHQGFCFDVAAIEKIEDFIKNVVEIQGPLDGMVYCVGPQCVRPLRMLNPGIVNEIITNGFGAYIELVRSVTKKNHFNQPMSIVSISSIASRAGSPGKTVYSAMKAAVDAAVPAGSGNISDSAASPASPALIAIGSVAGVALLGNLGLILFIVLKKKSGLV